MQEFEVTNEDCEKLIEKFESAENNRKDKVLSVNGFRRLLLSDWGHILKREHLEVFQNMQLPLSHYFICASHNT